MIKANYKSNKIEYYSWSSAKQRCINPNVKCYIHYGGRGIKMCDRWLNSFAYFYEDMGNKPSKQHTLDRIDNDGDYCKENCKWSTRAEQTTNQRKTITVTYNGKTMCAAQWEKELGFTRSVIAPRIKMGWSIEEALTTPVQNRNITFNGETLSTQAWDRKMNYRIGTIQQRLRYGWTIERAITTKVNNYTN